MENRLIPMTDFVLKTVQTTNINEAICWEQTEERLSKIYYYSLFLKKPLRLEMFVPCDDEGNVLEEPPAKSYVWGCDKYYAHKKAWENFTSAKEKVLFEGFEYCERDINILCVVNDGYHLMLNQKETIQDLVSYDITLTDSAIKKLAL